MKAIWLALLLTAACWAEAWKLVPGAGLGPIRLGDGEAQVKALNLVLTPGQGTLSSGQLILRYAEGVDLTIERGQVSQIILYNSTFNTKKGPVDVVMDGNLKIGSSVPQMESALGRPNLVHALTPNGKWAGVSASNYHAYTTRGLGVTTKDGKIISIAVWPRK